MRKIILIAVLCLVLAGCDRTELEDRGIVITLGIEKYENEFKIYAAFPDSESKQFTISGVGRTVNEALDNINAQISQSIYFGHTRVCIISEEILNDAELIKNVVQTFEENREISGRVIMLSTTDSIETILDTDVRSMTGVYISSFYDHSKETPKVDFTDFAASFYSNSILPLPKISVINENLVINENSV